MSKKTCHGVMHFFEMAQRTCVCGEQKIGLPRYANAHRPWLYEDTAFAFSTGKKGKRYKKEYSLAWWCRPGAFVPVDQKYYRKIRARIKAERGGNG